jgi:hypothetical protein
VAVAVTLPPTMAVQGVGPLAMGAGVTVGAVIDSRGQSAPVVTVLSESRHACWP